MGQAFTKLFDRWFGNREMRVVMLGLDAAGKTTILYKLHIGEVLTTVPTIGESEYDLKSRNKVGSLSAWASVTWNGPGPEAERARVRGLESFLAPLHHGQ